MRLLLDELLPALIAEQLRELGWEATAVVARPELRGLGDRDLFAIAQRESCALVTYNRDDFLALDLQYRGEGRDHHGIVILNPRRFSQGRASVGPLKASLAALVAADEPYPSFVHWLQ